MGWRDDNRCNVFRANGLFHIVMVGILLPIALWNIIAYLLGVKRRQRPD
jgi:hypothetical protein